jgi:hypothetical protein
LLAIDLERPQDPCLGCTRVVSCTAHQQQCHTSHMIMEF